MQRINLILALLFASSFTVAWQSLSSPSQCANLCGVAAPEEPQQALSAFELTPGFQIQQVCAEPLVCDPIAIDWGPDGRLWVVEMGGYPSGTEGPSASNDGGGGESESVVADDPALRSGAVGGGRVCFLGGYRSRRVLRQVDRLPGWTGISHQRHGVGTRCAGGLRHRTFSTPKIQTETDEPIGGGRC